jgi:class 3 adenylate cyclase
MSLSTSADKPSRKSSSKAAARAAEVFKAELQVVERTAKVSKDASLNFEDLLREYKALAQEYQLLLQEAVKITKVGDTMQEKLLKAQEQLQELNAQLADTNMQLKNERERSEELLRNILPSMIAERMKRGETTIADSYNEVTVLFADIVGFTHLSSATSPEFVVAILNDVFAYFDDLCEKYGLEKIKTIGDSYMAVSGVPEERRDHAIAAAETALEMLESLDKLELARMGHLSMRIGLNTGSVIAGVIGKKKFIYDLWGDTVNIASRMESQGVGGKIQVSESSFKLLKHRYIFEGPGKINVRGIGEMPTYFLVGRKPLF